MILGIGVDLTSVDRFASVLELAADGSYTHPLAKRCFSEEELSYAAQKAQPAEHLAAAYASKEAFAKALSFAQLSSFDFRRVYIEHTKQGAPCFVEDEYFLEIKQRYGIAQAHLSLSHDKGQACAFVVLEGK